MERMSEPQEVIAIISQTGDWIRRELLRLSVWMMLWCSAMRVTEVGQTVRAD